MRYADPRAAVTGRPIPLHPELDVATAADLATCQDRAVLGDYEPFAPVSLAGLVRSHDPCADSRLLQTQTVQNIFLGWRTVDGCDRIANATLLAPWKSRFTLRGARALKTRSCNGESRRIGATVTRARGRICLRGESGLVDREPAWSQ